MGLTTASLQIAIARIARDVNPIGDTLNQMDGVLGDGDLGVTMINGFNNMARVSDELPDDVGMAFMGGAKAMTKVSGSSFGTLMGIAMMAVAKKTKGQTDVAWDTMPDLLDAALTAMIDRGGANLGDKTVLDTLDAIKAAVAAQTDPTEMIEAARIAADAALDAYRDKACQIGRARVYGDKSKGIDDPGMFAVKLMLGSMATA